MLKDRTIAVPADAGTRIIAGQQRMDEILWCKPRELSRFGARFVKNAGIGGAGPSAALSKS